MDEGEIHPNISNHYVLEARQRVIFNGSLTFNFSRFIMSFVTPILCTYFQSGKIECVKTIPLFMLPVSNGTGL